MGSKYGTITIRKQAMMMFLNMQSRFLLFAFKLFSEFEEFQFHFACDWTEQLKPNVDTLPSKVESVCDSSSWNSSSSALLLDWYLSPSSASLTEWEPSLVRSTASPGTMSLWTRNCDPASLHTIPHDSRVPTCQKHVILLPLVFEMPLPAPVFNYHPESHPENKPGPRILPNLVWDPLNSMHC